MNQYYLEFIKILEKEEKDQAILYALDLLSNKKITIEELYEELLGPSLWNFSCPVSEQEVCIWKEHTRTSIVRTILESTYPEIIKRKALVKNINKKVVVFCPSEEYHEIGAIMVANYFALAGYDSQYIGANTPTEDIISAVKVFKPDYVAISVTNYYNLVVTKKLTSTIKEKFPNVKIIVGGQAFTRKETLKQVQYDFYLASIAGIQHLAKEESK